MARSDWRRMVRWWGWSKSWWGEGRRRLLARAPRTCWEDDDRSMDLLALNGSPKTDGTVAALLDEVTRAAKEGGARTERVDVYGLQVAPCIGCMACRPDKECVLEEDDAHVMARKLPECDGLVVATPTYWANMSSPLKALFDRIVPAIMGECDKGLPVPRHQGKPAVIVTACTTPWPF
ncbi:MAG: hypothetical protein GF320_16695, partial [Armatimonadia bacterium]|nr:hypothetical protein [Armatimonadia bacterium]